jgi:hypothetical protein
METTKTSVRINLTTREVKWQGTESFVEKQQATINEFIAKLMADPVQAAPPSNQKSDSQGSNLPALIKEPQRVSASNHTLEVPNSFGAFYIQFRRDATVSDKMLIAGFYIQSTSSDTLFTHKEAADLLNEQSVPVSNSGVFVKSLHKTGKLYIQSGKYKVAEKGIEYLKQLLVQS